MRKRLFLSGLFSSIFILVCIIAVIPVAGIPPQQLNATEQQATVNALVNERLTATSIIQTNMVATSEAATIPSATPIPTFTLMPTATFEGSFGSGLPTRSIVIDVSQDAFEHYIAGWEHYWRGDYRDAEDEFDEAIDLEPEWADAYLARAINHFVRQDYEDSLEDIEIAVELFDDADAGVLSWRIYLYIEFNNIRAAISDGEYVRTETPHDTVALYNLAYAYFANAQYEVALETIDLSIIYSPFDSLNFDLRADIHDEMGLSRDQRFDSDMVDGIEAVENSDYDEAIELFEEALDRASQTDQVDFNTALANWMLALTQYIDGNDDEAEDALNAAETAYPEMGNIYYLRAILQLDNVRDNEYLENLNTGIALVPNFPNNYISRALFHESNDNDELALADLWQYLQLKQAHSLLWQSIDPTQEELQLPFFEGWEHRFIIDAEAGDQLSITASESRIGSSFVDPIIMVIDPDGNPLAANNDERRSSVDAEISRLELVEAGQYTIIIGVGPGGDSGIVALEVELD